ncbi:hypothetical protein Pcinc_026957 [Petrolisthes cinctipes]|uniref:Uncharacterized protein n=1 Tax=Petrolisthes cinctipes TaxID=88211 RepID=A0AAE1F6E8_PETCI|nr:hypothetical protein Pcinc_026957 [Petrolisthes cinctipes]
MATWTSLVVLSLAVVSTLSFPSPDSEYNIPDVTSGTRSQYHIHHDDGTYKYGYSTGEDAYERAMSQTPGKVSGAFGYKDATGTSYSLEYTADERGFIPSGSHLPVAPEVPEKQPTAGYSVASRAREEDANTLQSSGASGATGLSAGEYSSFHSPSDTPSAGGYSASEFVPSPSESSHSDASYSFSYNAGDSSRTESADPNLNVHGSYSFVPPDNPTRLTVNYRAGSGIGFVAEGAHLPVEPEETPAKEDAASVHAGGSRPSLTEYSAAPSPTGYHAAPVGYARDPNPSLSPTPSPVPVASFPVEAARVRSSAGEDGSYSFSYDNSDSSRSESGDAQNKVNGRFSFVADDGIERNIQYTAGADTGFIAEGAHLPQGPPVPGAESGIPTGKIYPILSEEEANALAASGASGATGLSAGEYSSFHSPSDTPSAGGYSASEFVPSPSESSHSDASYSFSYNAGDSSRTESADPNLNVHGSYSFVPPDNPTRLTVNYRAGSGIGFVAEGAHLPVEPEETPAKEDAASVHAGGSRPSLTEYSAAPSPTGYHAAPVGYARDPNPSLSPTPSPVPVASFPVEAARVRSSAGEDGSYSFSYDNSDSSRSESGDAQNKVNGRFSFVADDGIERNIQYTAGADTGFIAEGAHLPQGPPVPGAESGIPTGKIYPILSEEEANALAASGASGATGLSAGEYSSFHSPSDTPSAGGYSASEFVPSPSESSHSDASYSFSYNAGDSSRTESADPNLNVHGSYSFVPPDNPTRLTVNYRAGSGIGFVAEGAHLPVEPEETPAKEDAASVHAGGSRPSLTEYSAAPSPTGYHAAPVGYARDPNPSLSPTPSPVPVASFPVEAARVRSSAGEDGSYSFSYDNSDSSRSESGDAQNKVNGRFSFVADDGIERNIQYTAGADTGFIAEGAHLPQGPPVPGAESGIPTGKIYPILSEEEANALAASGASGATGLSAGEYSSFHSPSDTPSAGGYSASEFVPSPSESSHSDASYSFSYNAGDSSRTESADPNLNVHGSYSFVPPDNPTRLTVNYRAGSGIGFVAEGAHLPVEPEEIPAKEDATSVHAGGSRPSLTEYSAAPSPKPPSFPHPLTYEAKPPTLSSLLVGDVLLHQYPATNSEKFGYVFTAVDH